MYVINNTQISWRKFQFQIAKSILKFAWFYLAQPDIVSVL